MRFVTTVRNWFTVAFASMSSAAIPNDESIIRHILTSSQTIALVGASNKPERPAYYVMKYLLQHGYTVIPINPGLEGKELLGQPVYGNLKSIPSEKFPSIDMVDIFRNSDAVPPIVDDAIEIGAKSIWMQVGVFHNEAAERAKAAGLNVVMNACPKMEIPRLGIEKKPASEL